MRAASAVVLALAGVLLPSCAHDRGGGNVVFAAPPPQRVPVEQIARAIPERVKDRRGWAEDVVLALDAIEVAPTRSPVCSVLAVIEQESGFQANPVVPGLSKIVQKKIDEATAKLGPVGRPALSALLDEKAPGQKRTFEERLAAARTEKDVDDVFRDLVAFYRAKFPRALAAADLLGETFTGRGLRDLNPITTAGSMQVSVQYAAALGGKRGLDEDEVREELYTRRGGVRYGTARLFGYEVGYVDPVHRFADYNAGVYASRNAAVQAQLSELLGTKLATDGDLLAYDDAGEPKDVDTNSLKALLAFRAAFAPEISERTVRKDVRKEKLLEFESTETWRALKRVYQKRTGRAPEYARIPNVALVSPKLSKGRTTEWFARNVKRRYDLCMKKLG